MDCQLLCPSERHHRNVCTREIMAVLTPLTWMPMIYGYSQVPFIPLDKEVLESLFFPEMLTFPTFPLLSPAHQYTRHLEICAVLSMYQFPSGFQSSEYTISSAEGTPLAPQVCDRPLTL